MDLVGYGRLDLRQYIKDRAKQMQHPLSHECNLAVFSIRHHIGQCESGGYEEIYLQMLIYHQGNVLTSMGLQCVNVIILHF